MIEQEGKNYRMVQTDKGPRPVLPLFKTAEVPKELISKMNIKPESLKNQEKWPTWNCLTCESEPIQYLQKEASDVRLFVVY